MISEVNDGKQMKNKKAETCDMCSAQKPNRTEDQSTLIFLR
jgi:hypothetical protein